MPQTAHIYVPSPSAANLAIGLEHGLWGWRASTLDRAGARAQVKSLVAGDFLLFGHRGPNSRVAPGGWEEASLKRVVVAQVVAPLFTSAESVWPDDDYPERIRMSVLDEEHDVAGAALGYAAMESLRLSANKQGAPVLHGGAVGIAELASCLVMPPPPDTATGSLDHDGETNALATVLVRREQQKLRRRKFGGQALLSCALCGRVLPSRMVRAAHIKRRSEATRLEQLLLANIMPACLMGCDELFEHGHVYVGADGIIEPGPSSRVTPDLEAAAKALAGRSLEGFDEHNAGFFAWHRLNIAH